MKNKIIFLDFDGVLNNKQDETSFFCLNPEKYGLSKTNLDALDYILEKTNAKIVLITSWRKHPLDYCYKYNNILFPSPLKTFLDKYKDKLFWINGGICPFLSKSLKRDDINGFFYITPIISDLTINDFNYVIIDDQRNQELDRFGDKFFCTDIKFGLSLSNAESIILKLNEI